MNQGVLGPGDYYQVLGPVVSDVAVDVMDDLIRPKRATKDLLGDDPMLVPAKPLPLRLSLAPLGFLCGVLISNCRSLLQRLFALSVELGQPRCLDVALGVAGAIEPLGQVMGAALRR